MAKSISVVRSGTNVKRLKEISYQGLNKTSTALTSFVAGSNVRIRNKRKN